MFGVAPVDNDGRFSRLHLSLEMTPFLLTSTLILFLTYRPPAWLPSRWYDPLDMAAVWAGSLPLLALLLGLGALLIALFVGITGPLLALAAAVAGLASNVRDPAPWRPSKFRLDVEALRCCG